MSDRPQTRSGGGGGGPTPMTGAMSPSVARLNTAQRAAKGFSGPVPVGLATNIAVDNRPVTNHGLSGMSTKPLGPGRTVADKSFYSQDLRNRIKDLTDEIMSMEQEADKIQKDNQQYLQLEKAMEASMQEVRTLEGQLADFNLALDKLRYNANVKEIRESFTELRNRNDYERRQIDEIFERTHSVEEKTTEIKDMIQNIYDNTAKRLESLGPATFQEYTSLQDESKALQSDIQIKEAKLAEYDKKIAQLQSTFRSSEFQTHLKGMELQKKKLALSKKQSELADESLVSLSPEEMRDKMMNKAKELTRECDQMERQKKLLEDQLDKYQDEIRTKETEIANAKKHASKAKTYETFYERDRKIQSFIDGFDREKAEEIEQKKSIQKTVVALLQHTSKGLALQLQLPDGKRFSEMRNDLSFKEQKLENSKQTLQLLQKDKEKRKEELDKINNLDKKIQTEMTSLKEKITGMLEEQEQFKSPEQLQADIDRDKEALRVERNRAKREREIFKIQMAQLSTAFEQSKKAILDCANTPKIDPLEGKLKTQASSIFQLSEFIATRKADSDWESVREDCMALISEINKIIIKTTEEEAGSPRS
jgi:intraflagellar transport protein 74